MKHGIGSFPAKYWVVIFMEFIERGCYYGVMSVLSVYLVMSVGDGGLGFSRESVGVIKSTITPLLYLLPIVSGALAEKFGYKRLLTAAFAVMTAGYLLTGLSNSYFGVFASLLLMVCGGGFFKPLISGTIARTTREENSSLGFGIFYWSINLGAFLFPLILIPYLKDISYTYIFYMAAIGCCSLLVINLLFYKDFPRATQSRSLGSVMKDAVLVLKDWRFIVMIAIYSCFWILYFQMFDTVLWYVNDFVNTEPLDGAVNRFLGFFTKNPSWKFDVEHVTVINAGTIILLQILVSEIVKKFKPLPTMISGMLFGSAGFIILSISTNIWTCLAGIIIFTLGEMVAHPKFLAYVGLVAPEEKKALYMGYSFLYGVIGSGIGGVLGAWLYVRFVDELGDPSTLWLIFAGIGFATIVGLLLYNRFVAPKK
ncbi:putative permease [Mucinivorans hirudinis]|uniref:Putative permease n=1 Tax=Mucinivorans hirudinis TaxID=1433126 RepID=A0A060R7N2_9BACT|nr:putative permease [Mucinivorans hirudinis]